MSASEPENSTRAKLRTEVMAVRWSDLVPQFARGALLLIEKRLDLLDVAEAMARDDRSTIEAFLSDGDLRRASDHDAHGFTAAAAEARFQCVIVQPWVLAQLIS